MKYVLIALLSLSLFSCRQDENAKQEDPPNCPMASADEIVLAAKNLPNLNVNPVYLELKSYWSISEVYYNRLRILNTSQGIEAEIFVNAGMPTRFCKKQITPSQLNDLVSRVNSSAICQSQAYVTDKCSMAMIAPDSLYAIDANGLVTVNLSPYNFEGPTSFCDRNEVENLQKAASDLFSDLNFATDCTTPAQ